MATNRNSAPTRDYGPDFNQDENSLAVRPSGELGVNRDVARVVQEVQGAIIVAKQFPRNEDEARVRLIRACKRPNFAEEAEYEFPRGGNDVSGPSVVLAREAARVWGNIQFGFEITQEDDVWRTIRAWAWDVEANSKPFQEDRFKKLIQRKRNGETQWVKPDERDLRELTNRRAAVCYRNCILQIIPRDLIDEAIDQARITIKDRAAKDPDGERKRIADAFAGDLNVMPKTLETILGHPLAEASPAEIAKLRAIYKSIRDGNSAIGEYLNQPGDTAVAGKTNSSLNNMKERYQQKNQEEENPQKPAEDQPELTPAQKERRETLRAEAQRQKDALAEQERLRQSSTQDEPQEQSDGIHLDFNQQLQPGEDGE